MEATPVYESEPSVRRKMSPWLIALLVVLITCIALCLVAFCVIVVLALLGPTIGNVFSNIVIGI